MGSVSLRRSAGFSPHYLGTNGVNGVRKTNKTEIRDFTLHHIIRWGVTQTPKRCIQPDNANEISTANVTGCVRFKCSCIFLKMIIEESSSVWDILSFNIDKVNVCSVETRTRAGNEGFIFSSEQPRSLLAEPEWYETSETRGDEETAMRGCAKWHADANRKAGRPRQKCVWGGRLYLW